MLEYYGEVEVEFGGEVARLNARGDLLTLTVPSDKMLLGLMGLYFHFPASKALSSAPFIFDTHRLVVCITEGGKLSIARRQGWLSQYLPYKFSVTGMGWWFRHGPKLLYHLWRA